MLAIDYWSKLNLFNRVMNDYNNIQSAIDQSSEINHPDNLDHQYEEDLDCKFQEFNCISLREEERSKQTII